MEKLEITNFLSIKKAEIEIKKLNIFIGPQAEGKSVIAKLIYFFKEYPQSIFDAIYGEKEKSEFDKGMLLRFEKIFPRYTWEVTEFAITYSNKYYSISAVNKKISDNEFSFNLSHSNLIGEVFISLVNFSNSVKSQGLKYNYPRIDLPPYLYDVLIDKLFSENKCRYIEEAIYIPAGRSFFANIEKNIFALINSDMKIDYFLKKFGKDYEYIKNNKLTRWDESTKDKPENIIQNLIGGKFISENGEDWIVNKQSKINLADSSSGQQEVLPITVLLSKKSNNVEFIASHFIIEEPEAHLFPVAQSQVVSLVALVYNELTERSDLDLSEETILQRQNTFTITTHSPYILTAFNNLIQAGNVAASKNHQNLAELYKIVAKSEIVDFNDVAAYLVNEGTVKSILNQDLKLIDSNIIDEISNHFADTFEKLINMEEMNE